MEGKMIEYMKINKNKIQSELFPTEKIFILNTVNKSLSAQNNTTQILRA